MEEVVLRLEELLFPTITDVAVLSGAVNGEVVRVEARSAASGTICPGCGSWSRRVHSSYLRFPVRQVLVPDPAQRALEPEKFEDPSGSPDRGDTASPTAPVSTTRSSTNCWPPGSAGTPTRSDALALALADERLGPRTVVWLNNAWQYLGIGATGERVASALHERLQRGAG